MITGKLILYTYHKPTKWGYPLKFMITCNRQTKPVHLKRYCELKYWDEENQEPLDDCPDKRLHSFVSSRKAWLEETLKEANENGYPVERVIEILSDPTNVVIPNMKLLEFYDIRIEELKEINKNVRLYETVKNQIFKYLKGNDIDLTKITYSWVHQFKDYKLSTTMQPNGVHPYLRNLKTLYYEARRRDYVDRASNPFDGNMPTLTRTKKLAINQNDWVKMEEICPKNRTSIFLLLFYLGGMSLIDLSLLKWSQIKNGRLIYERYKLRGRGFEINIKVFPKAKKIIDLLGTSDKKRVFNWIPCPETNYKKYQSFQNNINMRFFKPLGEQLELDRKVTSRAARHTFKTIGTRLNISDPLLMEIMGHEDDSVDARYLDYFPDEMKDQALAKIIGEEL